jgi:hypothetical protein
LEIGDSCVETPSPLQSGCDFQSQFILPFPGPISIEPEEIISGRAVIMSSRSFSVASFETVSASGVAPTFQMACWMGMEGKFQI